VELKPYQKAHKLVRPHNASLHIVLKCSDEQSL